MAAEVSLEINENSRENPLSVAVLFARKAEEATNIRCG